MGRELRWEREPGGARTSGHSFAMTRSLRPLFARHDVVRGIFVGVETAAILALPSAAAGLDFIAIDGQHRSWHPAAVADAINSIRFVGLSAWFRVPAVGHLIEMALDLGADGVVIPNVQSCDHARDLVAHCLYPPDGIRGYASSSRSVQLATAEARRTTGTTLRSEIVKMANERVIVVLQVETSSFAGELLETRSPPRTDVLLIGPTDLAIASGAPDRPVGDRANIELGSSLRRSQSAAIGISSGSARMQPFLSAGISVYIVGHDIELMEAALEVRLQKLRAEDSGGEAR